MDKLHHLETQYPELATRASPTSSVGYRPASRDAAVRHWHPMLSLTSTRTHEELRKFDQRIRRMIGFSTNEPLAYTAELKYDGIALSLQYERGRLARVLTRGDGTLGEDVTRSSLKYIPSIPRTIPAYDLDFEVRGEAYLSKSEVEKCCAAESERQQVVGHVHTRSLISGLLLRRKLDSVDRETIHASFSAYNIMLASGEFPARTHVEILQILKQIGFHNGEPFIHYLSNIQEFERIALDWSHRRAGLSFDVDGIVIKLNDLSSYARVGCTSHSPRYSIAFKFSPRRATSTILDIRLCVGRTGRVTPVALIDPVHISGTTISNVTLHNRDYLEKNSISVGCQVVVERSGDVIPKVVECLPPPPSMHEASRSALSWSICPCEKKTSLCTRNGDTFCVHAECAPQRQRRLAHFCAQLEIEGLGPSTLAQLSALGMVSDIQDVFALEQHASTLVSRRGWGERRVRNLLSSIAAARQRASLDKLLFALGIGGVGKESAVKIARHVKNNLETLRALSIAELRAIEQIGPTVAQSVHAYFSSESGRKLVDALGSLGLFSDIQQNSRTNTSLFSTVTSSETKNALSGKRLVFTGTLQSMARREAVRLAVRCGATPQSAVTNATDYIVRGSGSRASGKTRDAAGKQAIILTEDDYLDQLHSAGVHQGRHESSSNS